METSPSATATSLYDRFATFVYKKTGFLWGFEITRYSPEMVRNLPVWDRFTVSVHRCGRDTFVKGLVFLWDITVRLGWFAVHFNVLRYKKPTSNKETA